MTEKNATTHSYNDLDSVLPKTATKPIVVPKKRGRKGDQIAKAFKEVPTTPVDLIEYAGSYKLTTKTMRQLKRHDSSPELGQVFVRKNKQTKRMEIWRDPSITSKYLKVK